MFAIGDKIWPGISKLNEECGEVIQVIGKLMGSRGVIEHWSGNLLDMLYEEMGDVLGAIHFVAEYCKLDWDRIEKRAATKLRKFKRWHEEDPEDAGRTG